MAAQSRVKRFAKHLLVEDDDEQGAEGPLEEEETEETEETSFEEESEESEDDEPMTIARYLAEKAEQSAVEVYTRMESFHTLHVRRDQRRVLIEMERATMGDLFFHSLTLTGNEGSLPDMFNETPSNAGLHFVVAPNGTDIWLAEAQPAGSPSDFAAPVYDASSGGLQSGFRRSYRPLVDDVENGTVLLDITQWLLGFSKYVTKEGGGHRHSGVTLAETPPPPAPPAAPTEPTKKPKKIVKKKRKPTPMPGGQNGESVVLVEARTFPKNFLLRIAVQQQGGFGSPMRPQERAPSSSSVSSSRLRRPRRGAQHTCRGGACCGISLRSEETGLDQLDAADQRNGGNAMFGFGGPPPSGTAYFTASFGLLPKIPMTPRVWDRRVGYFLNDVRIGGPRDVTKDMKVIHRWSLERNPWVEEEEEEDTIKRTAPPLSTSSEDAAGGVDDTADAAAVLPPSPLPPRSRLDASAHGCISYYIDPHVPPLFHGTIKQGVLAWNAAFAKAGRFGPSGSGVMRCFAPGDPGWPSDYALGDLRYNSIFMTNPAMAGLYGYGPSVVDYRSGEILVGSVLLGFDAFVQFTASHNLDQLNRVRSKQFEAFNMSPLLPVDHPDVHRKLLFTTIHEIGHNLGLRHNFLSAAEGHTSIMDYPDANDTTNPSAAVVGGHLLSAPGIYDEYAIRYGYSSLLGEVRGARHNGLEALASGYDLSAIVSPPLGSRYIDGLLLFPPINPLFGTDGDAHGGLDPRINTHNHDVHLMGRDKLQFLAHRRKVLLKLVQGGAITPATYLEKFSGAVGGAYAKVNFCTAWVGARLINRQRTATYVPRPQHLHVLVGVVLDLILGSSLRCDAQEQQSLCGANAWDEYGSGTSATWLSTHRKRTKGVLGSLLDQEKLLRLEQHAVELLDRAHHATAARVGAGILPDAPPPPAVSTESESAAATPATTSGWGHRTRWEPDASSMVGGDGSGIAGVLVLPNLESAKPMIRSVPLGVGGVSTVASPTDASTAAPIIGTFDLLMALAFGRGSEAEGLFAPLRPRSEFDAAAKAPPIRSVEANGLDAARCQARLVFAQIVAKLAFSKSTMRSAPAVSAAARAFVTEAVATFDAMEATYEAEANEREATKGGELAGEHTITIKDYNPHRSVQEQDVHAETEEESALARSAISPLLQMAPVALAQWRLTFEVLQERPKEGGGGGGRGLMSLFGRRRGGGGGDRIARL